MADKTSVGHVVSITRDDIIRALKRIALQRLLEKSPGLAIDPQDWHEEAEVFLPDTVTNVQVTIGKV